MHHQKFDFRSIKTLEDACKATGTNPAVFNLPGLPDHVVAYWQLTTIVQAINNDKSFPDWNYPDQRKWSPRFEVLPSGSGFSRSKSLFDGASTDVSSLLCFKTEIACDYARKQFEEIYKRYTLKKF